jgi:transcriptional regulator with XRE-family HTH domain
MPGDIDPRWTREEREHFGAGLKRLRKARGWKQQDLADRLRAAPSWVSQVENGKLPPSGERLATLEVFLGPELQQLVPGGATTATAARQESAAFACLWRARADLLARLANASDLRARRVRLDHLSRELIAAASVHPKAQPFVHRGVLASLAEIGRSMPEWSRQAVLVELAGMKLDAPYETGFSRSRRLEFLDFSIADLRLPAATHTPLVEAFAMFPQPRDRPLWQELHAVGGALGVAQAGNPESEVDLRLLIGDDPAGWFGFEYAAGAWLVRSVHPGAAAMSPGHDGVRLMALQSPIGLGGEWASDRAATGILSSLALGPILGSAIGAALGAIAGAIASDRRTHKPTRSQPAAPHLPPDKATIPHEPERITATLAEALGRHWVRAETSKLVAAYRAFPATAVGDENPMLPPVAVAREHLTATAKLLGDWWKVESETSGTTSPGANERLRELADIKATLLAAKELLPVAPPTAARPL